MKRLIHWRQIRLPATAGTALLVLALMAFGAQAALPAGKTAPDFTLKSLTGKNLKLSDYRGQVVLINFWASWCGPCRQEMPRLNKLYQDFRRAGFVILGVNVDDKRATARRFAQQLSVSFPVVHDSRKQVSQRYGLDAMPYTVIVDRDGKVAQVHRGYRSGVEKQYRDVIHKLLRM